MLPAGGRPGVPAAHAAGERRQGLGGQKQKWQEFPPVRALGCREFHVSNMFRGLFGLLRLRGVEVFSARKAVTS